VCPTGAILSKPYKFTARSWFLEEKDMICPFCGIGCTLTLGIREGKILRSRGKEGNGLNKGNLCGRGRFGIDYIYSENRLKTPLVREGDEFSAISWEDALSYIAEHLGALISKYGPDSVGAIGSPRCTNEDNYTLRKFIKETIGSGNLDSSAAFGYAGVQAAWERAFGLKEHPVDIEAPIGKEVILIIESDLSVTHPVLGLNILQARREGTSLIVADSRETKLTRHSSLWLRIHDGTSVAFLNGLANIILEKGLCDEQAARAIPGYEELRKTVSEYSPAAVSDITGIPEDALISTAKTLASAGKRLLGLSVRASENTKGTDTVYAAANLINILGDSPDSLMIPAEFSNTFGMYEMGATPEVPHGSGVREMLYKETSSLRSLYIMGEDPVTSFPDGVKITERLRALDFLIVQDIFMTETAKLANVVLPASSWGEKEGTFTNMSGIDQKVFRLVDPAGQSMPDWMIIKNLSLTMEKELGVRNLTDIQREIAEMRSAKDNGELKREFIPVRHETGEQPDGEYPFRLVIRDVLQHSGIMSTKSKSLDLVISEALLEINPSDAEKSGIRENAHVKVTSRQGSVFLKAKMSEEVPEGTVFVPAHFPFAKINTLTRLASNGEQPISAVKIEPAL
jgi:formate dehydrogenase alpha subunit